MSNSIEIKGIRGHGWHGVLPEELRDGQEFTIDVTLHVATGVAAEYDDLSRTVNYATVARLVHAHIVGKPFQLIETLAHHIAEDLLAMEHVDSVSVAVHKPHAPIGVPFDDVIVTVHRSR